MRAIVLNSRIVKMLTLFVVIIPRLARSDANLAHSSRLADTSNRELVRAKFVVYPAVVASLLRAFLLRGFILPCATPSCCRTFTV